MLKILIVYYSRTGNTKTMAESVKAGVDDIQGVETTCLAVDQVNVRDLIEYEGIILGSPVYYGTMAAEMKKLIDESVAIHRRWQGKVGGAFASSAYVGGGNETTVLDLIKALLIHGMIIQGTPEGDHYGPVSIGEPDERAKKECRKLGRRVAELVLKLHG